MIISKFMLTEFFPPSSPTTDKLARRRRRRNWECVCVWQENSFDWLTDWLSSSCSCFSYKRVYTFSSAASIELYSNWSCFIYAFVRLVKTKKSVEKAPRFGIYHPKQTTLPTDIYLETSPLKKNLEIADSGIGNELVFKSYFSNFEQQSSRIIPQFWI